MAQTSEERLRLIIEAEVTKALANVATFEKALTHMAGGVQQVNSNAAKTDQLGGAFGRLGSSAASALNPINALKGALPLLAFGSIATGVFKTAAAFETARQQFGILLQDAEAGDKVFENLLAFNSKTPFSQTALNSLATQLLNAKVSAENLIPTISRLGDLSKGNEEKLATLGEVYGRIAIKGKASMEELNRVMEAAIPITDAIGEAMGVSGAKVIDMTSKGQVSFEAFRVAIDKLTGAGGQYNGMMDKMAQNTAGKFSTAMGNIEILAGTAGESLDGMTKAGLDGFIDLTEAAIKLLNAADPLIKPFGDLMGILVAAPLENTAKVLGGITDGLYALTGNSAKASGSVKAAGEAVAKTNEAWTANIKIYRELEGKQDKTKDEAVRLKTAYANLKSMLPGVTEETMRFALATSNVTAAMKLQEMAAGITQMREALAPLKADSQRAANEMWQAFQGKAAKTKEMFGDFKIRTGIEVVVPDDVASRTFGTLEKKLMTGKDGLVKLNVLDLDALSAADRLTVLQANITRVSKELGQSAVSDWSAKIQAELKATQALNDAKSDLANTEKTLKKLEGGKPQGIVAPLTGIEPTSLEKWTAAWKDYSDAFDATERSAANLSLNPDELTQNLNGVRQAFVNAVSGLDGLDGGKVGIIRSINAAIGDLEGSTEGAVSGFDQAMNQYARSLGEATHAHEILGTSANELASDENKATQAFVDLASRLPDLTADQITVIKTVKAGIKSVPEDIERVKQSLESGMSRFGDFGTIVGKALVNLAPEKAQRDIDEFLKKYGDGFGALFDSIGASASLTFETLSASQTAAMEHEISLLERQKEAYKRSSDSEIAILEEQGLSTVDARIRQANEEERQQAAIDRKKSDMARKQFESEKQAKLAQIAMATALGVANTISAGPWAIPLALGVIALGGVQAGIVNSQQYPEAFDGAIIQGSSAGTVLRAGEKNQTELVLPLREEKLRQLGITGGSGISVGQLSVYSNAYDPAEVARHVIIELDKKTRVGR